MGHTWSLAGGTGAALHQLWRREGPLWFLLNSCTCPLLAFQAGLRLTSRPSACLRSTWHPVFILERAGSWQRGLKWCPHFILEMGKCLLFGSHSFSVHIRMASKFKREIPSPRFMGCVIIGSRTMGLSAEASAEPRSHQQASSNEWVPLASSWQLGL